jgi:hypothetical protein
MTTPHERYKRQKLGDFWVIWDNELAEIVHKSTDYVQSILVWEHLMEQV